MLVNWTKMAFLMNKYLANPKLSALFAVPRVLFSNKSYFFRELPFSDTFVHLADTVPCCYDEHFSKNFRDLWIVRETEHS